MIVIVFHKYLAMNWVFAVVLMIGPESLVHVAMSPHGGRFSKGAELTIKLDSVIPRIMDCTCEPEKLMGQEEVTKDSLGVSNNSWMKKQNPIKLNVHPGFSFYPQTVTLF